MQGSVYAQSEQNSGEIKAFMDSVRNELITVSRFCGSLSEQDYAEFSMIVDELSELACAVERYCTDHLKVKYNDVMQKYKQIAGRETASVMARIGFFSKDSDMQQMQICCDLDSLTVTEETLSRDIEQAEPMYVQLYKQLDDQEQELFKELITDMFNFCKDTLRSVDGIVKKHAAFESKMKSLMSLTDQMMVVAIGFDYPFPAIQYKLM